MAAEVKRKPPDTPDASTMGDAADEADDKAKVLPTAAAAATPAPAPDRPKKRRRTGTCHRGGGGHVGAASQG